MAIIVGDVPPAAVIAAAIASESKIVRWVDIYQSDNTTLFASHVAVTDGSVSVDQTRAERRNLDLTLLDDGSGAATYGPGNLWYDKIIKPYRGVQLPDYYESGYVKIGGNAYLSITRSALVSITHLRQSIKISFDSLPTLLTPVAGWNNINARLMFGSDQKVTVQLLSTTGAGIGGAASTVAVPGIAPNVKVWISGQVQVSNAQCTYWYSYDDTNDVDAVNWIPLGTVVTGSNAGAAVRVADSTTVGIGSAPGQTPWPSKVYAYAEYISTAKTIEVDCGGLVPPTANFPAISGQTVVPVTSGTWPYYVQRVLSTGDTWVTPLGEFLIDTIDRGRFPRTVHLTGRDFTKKLMLAKLATATSFAAGTNVNAIISALVSVTAGINKYTIPVGTQTLSALVAWERGTAVQDMVQQLCDAYSKEAFFDNFGYFTLREFQDPLTAPLAFSFTTNPATGTLADYSRSTNDNQMFNHVVVGSDNAQTPLVYAEVENNNINSPTRIAAIGRRTYSYSSGAITDTATATARATALLKVMGLEQYDLTLTSLVLPWLEAGEACEVILPDSVPTDPTRFLLSSFNIPFALSTMSANARRVTLVG